MRLRFIYLVVALVALAVPSAASAAFAHTVTSGESLDSIAAADGMTVADLAAANGLSPDASLVTGQTVMIPPRGDVAPSSDTSSSGSSGASSSASSGASSSGSASEGGYVVQPGDTLSGIAAQEGVSVSELAAENGLDVGGLLLAGAVLQVSGGSSGDSGAGSVSSADSSASGSSSSSGAAASGQPVGAGGQGSADTPPYPTPEHVSASEVSSIANANGVPASLAEAIGWQESGFNNDIVSSADARGVMQILPGTWDYIQRNLAGNDPLGPASASENVRGGVLLLHDLLSATGGDPTLAAAGYYQGLSSVRQNGLFTDTQQYVNDVMALQQRFGGP